MRSWRVATLTVLVIWVLLGPVGMALSGCMMMDGCDVLCSVLSFAPMIAGTPFAQTTTMQGPSGVVFSPQNVWSVPDSPPKPTAALL